MLICPVCKTQYDDDTLEKCPNEGAALVSAPKLADNPPIPEVTPAAPDAITSDFDIEAVQHEIQNLETPPSTPESGAEEESPPPPALEQAPTVSSPVSQSRARKPRWLFFIVALVIIGGASFGVYSWLKGRDLVNVELRSNPPGATVLLDGKNVGISPLSVKINKGVHHVVFQSEGYASIEETIIVANDGHVVVKTMTPVATPPPR